MATSVARAGRPGSRVMVNGKTEYSNQEHVHGLICFAGRRMATVEGCHCGKYANARLGHAIRNTVLTKHTRVQPLHTAASSVARAGRPGSRVMVNGKTE